MADLRRSGVGSGARSTSSPVFPMAPRKIWQADIVSYALPMPLIGCGVATLAIWIDIPLGAATLAGFFIAFRVRMRLTRRPSQA